MDVAEKEEIKNIIKGESTLQIKIIDIGEVSTEKRGNNSWQQYEVTYKDLEKNKVTGHRLMSFKNPEVFEYFKHVNKDDTITVQIAKNEAGFWEWVSVGESEWPVASAGAKSNAKPTAKTYTPTSKPVSQYETREERAARQQFIIRQSSIASAIELVGHGKTVDAVLNVAQQFTDWVNKKDAVQDIKNMSDDVV